MKKSLAGVLLLLLNTTALAGGGEAGNGGGVSERLIMFAYLNLENYIDMCLHSPFCGIDPKERQILVMIEKEMPQERKNPDQIKFSSGKNNTFFMIDGLVKVAKTGDAIGSTVYFNTDMLYFFDKNDSFSPIPLSTAVGMLIHEMGHHHHIKDHQFLDLLGAKVQNALLRESLTAKIYARGADFPIVATMTYNNDSFQSLIITCKDAYLDLSHQLKVLTHHDGARLYSAVIRNLYWVIDSGISVESKNSYFFRLRITADLLRIWSPASAAFMKEIDFVVSYNFLSHDLKYWPEILEPTETYSTPSKSFKSIAIPIHSMLPVAVGQ